jgi:hypothetical protein
MDLRPALARRSEVAPGGGHQFIEDTAGVRHADFHSDALVRLVRPGSGRLYLRRNADGREIMLPPELAVLNTAELPLEEPRSSVRDAAHDAFTELFAMPFNSAVVSTYTFRDDPVVHTPAASAPATQSWWLRPGTLVGFGLGAAGLVSGGWGAAMLLDARRLHDGAAPMISQADAAALNSEVYGRNRRGSELVCLGVAALAGGLVAVLLQGPRAQSGVDVAFSPDAVTGGIRGAF